MLSVCGYWLFFLLFMSSGSVPFFACFLLPNTLNSSRSFQQPGKREQKVLQQILVYIYYLIKIIVTLKEKNYSCSNSNRHFITLNFYQLDKVKGRTNIKFFLEKKFGKKNSFRDAQTPQPWWKSINTIDKITRYTFHVHKNGKIFLHTGCMFNKTS